MDLGTIRASEILPVDLNCLLYMLEKTLSEGFSIKGEADQATHYEGLASTRKALILQYFWNAETGFFHDYDFINNHQTDVLSLAGMFPMFVGIATPEQAVSCAEVIREKFLKPGGLVTTLIHSGQQWDAPNGWAPLQWVGIQGLRNYGFEELAQQTKDNWVSLNSQVYQRTGKMLEKYNVEDTTLLSGGGEYPVQDGFGWTNGVLLALLKE